MSAAPADLIIHARWVVPMTNPQSILEDHAVVVRDGRILDVLPRELAAERYAADVAVSRPGHVLMPGLINARRHGAAAAAAVLPDIAAMLEAGTTCFCSVDPHPGDAARIAVEQGMRALIGMPVAAAASAWAATADEYLTRALQFRDEYRDHPAIATAFAPLAPASLDDATFRRIATLADELDAGILMTLHASAADVRECVERHGLRPLERMNALGLLTPALNASCMSQVDRSDIALASRCGIAVTLCPQASLRQGGGAPPVAAWAAAGVRLALGTGTAGTDASLDLWMEMRLLALLSRVEGGDGGLSAWEALAAATRGGAAALGLEADLGTLEPGKWADLCSVDLRGRVCPQPLEYLVFEGGRHLLRDVWVSGRHLLNAGTPTRLDRPNLATRAPGE